MLIINADDWGRNRTATDNSMLCFKEGRITSASAMVFMEDSQRAAEMALENGIDTGLHLNFSLAFDGNRKSSKLLRCQQRIASFLKTNKYSFLLYNPLLKGDFHYVYNSQYEEYVHLYNRVPTHFDGHHHLHLCTNILADRLIPKGAKVRRSFTFSRGEKSSFNRLYRHVVDAILKRRYQCTDYFYSFAILLRSGSLETIRDLARSRNVEVMVHPERNEEIDYLMSDEYFNMISAVNIGNYLLL